jgi:hypothetical protein
MSETPRSSFRLRRRTLDRIEAIKATLAEESYAYRKLSKTDVIEMGVDELYRKHCPKDAKPKDLPGQGRMSERTDP